MCYLVKICWRDAETENAEVPSCRLVWLIFFFLYLRMTCSKQGILEKSCFSWSNFRPSIQHGWAVLWQRMSFQNWSIAPGQRAVRQAFIFCKLIAFSAPTSLKDALFLFLVYLWSPWACCSKVWVLSLLSFFKNIKHIVQQCMDQIFWNEWDKKAMEIINSYFAICWHLPCSIPATTHT